MATAVMDDSESSAASEVRAAMRLRTKYGEVKCSYEGCGRELTLLDPSELWFRWLFTVDGRCWCVSHQCGIHDPDLRLVRRPLEEDE